MSPALQVVVQFGMYFVIGFLFGLGFHLAKKLLKA